MTVSNLQYLLEPSTVALIGASESPSTVGEVLTHNLLCSGFTGEVYLVNPNHDTIAGVKCHPNVASLPKAPDLAVIATPPDSVPGLIEELAARGAKGAVVITAGLGEGGDKEGKRLCVRMLDAARPQLLRIIGPNCLGIMMPGSGLNASMAHIARPLPGNIAFVAQSGAVQTSVLDWAVTRGIGFSCFISLGDMADVDFGDILDYLATDFHTRAILLYMETVTNARKFMSAARAASRVKPVIVIKAGRFKEGAMAAARHTGAVAGDDAVCDAAFRRAGMLRVYEMQSLFDAVETLAMAPHSISGDGLAILTNGGGIGVMATDALIEREGRLAELASETMNGLDVVLPPAWSKGNPVDIMSDASAQRYADALRVLLDDRNIDAVLVLNCPIAVISATEAAVAVIETYKERLKSSKPPVLLTSWLGEGAASEARQLFAQHRIPTYRTPTDAVRAFMHMVRYKKNQQMLMETPPSIPEFYHDVEAALRVIEAALAEGREWLSGVQTKSLLEAYGIPVRQTVTTRPPDNSEGFASTWRDSATGQDGIPDRGLSPGSMAEPMGRSNAHQLMIRVTDDAQFGPVITFGHGSGSAEEIQDRALALPPLNRHLSREMMSRTRICRLLGGLRGMPAANLEAIALTLVKISQLICDVAEVAELDINPLLADASGVMAVNARIRVKRSAISASERLAIRPYPKELEDSITLPDGELLRIRPIRPEDEPGFLKIFESLSLEDRRMRFLHPLNVLSHSEAALLTQIDYDREMAFVLAGKSSSEDGSEELYGSVRILVNPDRERAEYAIWVRKDAAGKGLGKILMRRIIDYARSRGIKEIFGQVLRENIAMLKVCNALGFTSRFDPDEPGIITVSLKL
ncbi:MAG: GNAT family N-acetyltransferase [Syntrophobacteraceae bacterium]